MTPNKNTADDALVELAEERATLEAKGQSVTDATTNSKPKKKEDPEGGFEIPEELTGGEWLHEVGFFRVGVEIPGLLDSDDEPLIDAVVCTDPGTTHLSYLQGYESDELEVRQRAYLALARGISRWRIPSLRACSELGVAEEGPLPQPKDLVADHEAAWKGYKEEMRLAFTANETLAKSEGVELDDLSEKADGYAAYPEAPRTQLQVLLSEELPSQVLIRIVAGILHACLKFKGGKGVRGTGLGN